MQQWRTFLLNALNKKALTVFVSKEWKQETDERRLPDKVLFVACEEECPQILSQGLFTVEDLNSTQKEADTKICIVFVFLYLFVPPIPK